ncbi:MAG: hypothetical protein GX552_15040 [Chloroflexi bacterium]|nr:hypothetical protein [Chloroflexota bacterium]
MHRKGAFWGLPGSWLIIACALLSLVCWGILAGLYWLPDYYDIPAFSLDKLPGYSASPTFRLTVVLFVALALFYSLGLWAIVRATRSQPLTRSIKLVLALWIVGGGVAMLFMYPITALDVFTYLTVLKGPYFYGQNPYLVTVAMRPNDPWTAFDFVPGNPALYGPGWLSMSALPALFINWNDLLSGLFALKGFNLLLLALTGVIIARYQDDPSKRWLAAWVFLANPLVLFEGVGNGHNDIYAVVALAGAMLALKRRSVLVLPLLALSISVKFLTVILVPLFAVPLLAERWGWRKLAVGAGLALLVAVGVTAPFWAGGEMLSGLMDSAENYYQFPGSSILLMAYAYLQQSGASGDSAMLLLPMLTVPVVLTCGWTAWRYLRGGSFTLAAVAMLLVALQFLTRYCQWYLLFPLLFVALDRERIGTTMLTVVMALNLIWYPVIVWAFFDSGLPQMGIQWLGVAFLTAPTLALVGWWAWREGGLSGLWRRRRALVSAPAVPGEEPAAPRDEPGQEEGE